MTGKLKDGFPMWRLHDHINHLIVKAEQDFQAAEGDET